MLITFTNRWLVKERVQVVFSDETRQPAGTSLSIVFFLNWNRPLKWLIRMFVSLTYDSLQRRRIRAVSKEAVDDVVATLTSWVWVIDTRGQCDRER